VPHVVETTTAREGAGLTYYVCIAASVDTLSDDISSIITPSESLRIPCLRPSGRPEGKVDVESL